MLRRSFTPTAALAALIGLSATTASADTLPRFATHERTSITCNATPFGRHVTLGGEYEAVSLLATSGGLNQFDEYQPLVPLGPTPLTRTFRAGIYQGALAGTTFLKAVKVDLNGDGRDEVVAVHRVNGTGHLRLGVFRRSAGPGSELFDTWTVAQTFNEVDIVAGDFDGSSDNKQELAVLVRTPTFMRVYLLRGAASGAILEADDSVAGMWTRNGTVGAVSVTAGDMLLDGRDQVVVVNESGSGASRALNYHLIEYQPTTAQLPIAPGDMAVGSKSFQSVLGTSYMTDSGANPAIQSIVRVEADAGDLVDSAAAELVVHTQFVSSGANYLGQRLHHFTTTRNPLNQITAIGFASRGLGLEYDASRLIQDQDMGLVRSFEAVIANIDRVSPAEIVLVRADINPRLLVSAYKVRVETAAGFRFAANGLTVQFTDTSTGSIVAREWNFGDNSGPIAVINPTKL